MNHTSILTAVFATFAGLLGHAALGLEIEQVQPTPLFPVPIRGEPLVQFARLHLVNPAGPIAAVARITLGAGHLRRRNSVALAHGKPVVEVKIPDIAAPAPLTVEILGKDGRLLASRKLAWQPQRKWKLYCVSYCHQDLGFGDYPHRLRTNIRHANIERLLRSAARPTTGMTTASSVT